MMIISQAAARRARRLARCAAGFMLGVATLAATSAHADIPPPEPSTFWGHNQAPDATHVLVGGACILAAIVLAGLIVAWQLGTRSRAGKQGLAVFTILFVAAAALTVGLPLRIQWENAQWQDWDRRDSARRSRGGDRWPDFGKERGASAGPSDAPQSAGGAEGTSPKERAEAKPFEHNK